MPGPRVFVSSTAYDLAVLRGQLRTFIDSLGFEPALSEHADILYDPRTDTQLSCIKEIPNCDMLVLIIGSRFGSSVTPQVAESIDFDQLARCSDDLSFVREKSAGTYSVTQLEVVSAILAGIPVFAFVDQRVMTDYDTYEANRNSPFIDDLRFGTIESPDTAKYVFGFISFLRARVTNNALVAFSNVAEIEVHLRKQWSALFQRMLSEQRGQDSEQQQIDRLAEQFENLQTAILASIGSNMSKDIARGVVNYRYLVEALLSIDISKARQAIIEEKSWKELLQSVGIRSVVATEDGRLKNIYLVMEDEQVLMSRIQGRRWELFRDEWVSFMALPLQARTDIFDALAEDFKPRSGLFRPVRPAQHGEDLQLMGLVTERENEMEETRAREALNKMADTLGVPRGPAPWPDDG